MPSKRTGYAPWSLTREAGVQSATVEGTIEVPQNVQPTLSTGFVDEKGNWIIHDYKTGKRPYNQKEADQDMQLGLYQIGLEKTKKNIKDVLLVWHFLQQSKENILVYSKRSKSDLEKIVKKIVNLIDEIRLKLFKNEKFVAKKSILCNWCYYWQECPLQEGSNPYLPS